MEENTDLTITNPNFPTGKREIFLLIAMAVCGVLMADFIFYGGFNLGFALMTIAVSCLSFVYLRRSGCKGGAYAGALFVLNLVIAASFIRSDDGLIKFVMVCFLLIGGNLSMVLTAGQNRRDPGGLLSLLDVPMAMFTFGLGQMGKALGGVNDARKNAGTAGKKNMAVLAGLAVAVPVLAILIPLLIRADAAFEGLLKLLPEWDPTEMIISLIFGIPIACILYSRNTGLNHRSRAERDPWTPRHFSSLTINTVLVCVGIVYCVYLVSQLAYFVGGFSGILPEEFTMAEYARRGFFEMTWLAVINLGIIVVTVALAEPKDGKVPLFTRGLCLFIGIVTLFFAATASAKMFLYIGSYGLTRLRLLVQVIIIFIALTVVFVAVWLFKPKFAYMKAVLLSAMVIGACVAWMDVDTVVAAYNVDAYQSGKLETVDMNHLCSLGDGAVPYLQELTEDADPMVAAAAERELYARGRQESHNFRAWNIAVGAADEILEQYQREVDTDPGAVTVPQIFAEHEQALTVTAQVLNDRHAEFRSEEEVTVIHFKDELVLLEDGRVINSDIPIEFLESIQNAGINKAWGTESYVLFWMGEVQTEGLLWTEHPDVAMESIWELYPYAVLTALTDQWYALETMEGMS